MPAPHCSDKYEICEQVKKFYAASCNRTEDLKVLTEYRLQGYLVNIKTKLSK
jgi:hypothetical protein